MLEVIVALVVFVGGFELAPALHTYDHDALAPHTHEGASDVGLPPASTHERDVVSRGAGRSAHSHGAVAHRGVAFLHPPSPMPLVPLAGLLGRLPATHAPRHRARLHTQRHDARGPPIHA